MSVPDGGFVHTLSVVVPVYQGERTLRPLLAEIAPLASGGTTPAGHAYRVTEVVLVHDGGPDGSPVVMRALAAEHAFVRALFLSRNYGQHPATLAGMASTSGEWAVTLDEDGQYDPAEIPAMLDVALAEGSHLVYGVPRNPPPHGLLRNAASRLAKAAFGALLGSGAARFSSFRLVWGEVARSLAAYSGTGVYLDVALSWVVGAGTTCPITARGEGGRRSGYTLRKLLAHFWRMVLTSGTRPLQFIAWLGVVSVLFAALLAGWAVWQKLTNQVPVQGWTSLVIVVSFFSGCILLSLGILAEYLGLTVSAALGRPLYLVVSRAAREASRKP